MCLTLAVSWGKTLSLRLDANEADGRNDLLKTGELHFISVPVDENQKGFFLTTSGNEVKKRFGESPGQDSERPT